LSIGVLLQKNDQGTRIRSANRGPRKFINDIGRGLVPAREMVPLQGDDTVMQHSGATAVSG